MELYSWPDEKGQWAFSLLPGTNRNKTVEEVREQPLSLAGVKEGISRLAVGEQVLWITRVYDSSGGWVAFPLPPADVVQELKQFASSNQVILQ
jgi:hypothetical protein